MPELLFNLGRQSIKDTKPYQAGKPIEELERELGLQNIIKLASNENPLGASPKAIKAAKEALNNIHIYPDAAYHRLREKLADYAQVDIKNITVGNGSENCLECLIKAYIAPGDEVIMDQYCFATIRILVNAYSGLEILIPSQNYRHDVEKTLNAISPQTKMIIVVNPNNPTGTYINNDELTYLLANTPANVLVVVDEAYFEYMSKPGYPNSVLLQKSHPNLIISRTYSKVYGLAGLRLGYLLTTPAISELLHRSRLPFNVNSVAVEAGIAALDDTGFLADSCKTNTAGLIQLTQGFNELGINYIPSVANFITIELNLPAIELYQKLLTRGIIVRPLVPYGLPNHLRVTIGTFTQNQQFLTALKEVYYA